MERGVKRAWCILLILAALSFSMDLEEAQKLALENYTEIKLEKLALEEARQRKLDSLGELMPVLNFEASFNLARKQSFFLVLPSTPPQEFVFLKGSYPSFTLQLKQELFNLQKLRKYEIATQELSRKRFMVEEKKNQILFRLREAYINALKTKAAMEIYEKHLELVKAHLRDVEELYREGLVAFKDVLETKVKLYEVKEALTNAESNYRKALKYLSYMTSYEVKEVKEIRNTKGYLELTKRQPRELEELLLKNRPILSFLKSATEIAKGYVELSKSSFYPQMVFEAIYQRTEESDLFPKDRYFVSFALRWNLFSGLRRFRAVELSKIAHRKSSQLYQDTEEKLLMELNNVLEDIKTARVKIELAKEQLKEAKEHLRIAQEKYRAGMGTNTEVLDAQSYLITAENTLRISTYDLLLKAFKLSEVIGHER